MENSSMIKIGPVGAPDSGNPWDEKGEIVQIFVSHDTKIHSLQFQYVKDNGELVLSDTHGQNTGDNFHVVHLNYPSEYIIYISGNYGKIGFYKYCLTSIKFGTNLGTTYGPYGEPSRSDHKGFTLHLGSRRQFGGFHGTADTFVRSIGMYVKPISKLKEKDVPKRP